MRTFPMSGPLATSIARLYRRGASALLSSIAPDDESVPRVRDSRIGRHTARQLAALLDRAMQLGLWEHADRVASTAASVAHVHTGLTERLARLRLRQGQPESALAMIDSCQARPSSLRLLRNICLVQSGRRGEAHLDLHRWATRASCPLQARIMLALLERDLGDDQAATEALRGNLRHMDDPQTLAALVMLCMESGRTEQAHAWAGRLRRACVACSTAPAIDIMLRSVGMRGIDQSADTDESHVQQLCTELLAQEHAIGALVAAQELEPDISSGRLLAAALEQALPDLESPANGYEALSRLSMALGDHDAALAWARRGLEMCPMSAALVRLTGDLCDSFATSTRADDLEQAA
jgi:tetratricopeptide (TPR) repeat protein